MLNIGPLGPTINPGDILLTGSADMTARSWSIEGSSKPCMVLLKNP